MRLRPHTHAAPLEFAVLDFEKKLRNTARQRRYSRHRFRTNSFFHNSLPGAATPKRFPVKWSYHSLAGGYYYPEWRSARGVENFFYKSFTSFVPCKTYVHAVRRPSTPVDINQSSV